MHPKVAWAAVAAALTTILVWVAGMFHIAVPAEVAAAVTTIISTGTGYLVPGGDA